MPPLLEEAEERLPKLVSVHIWDYIGATWQETEAPAAPGAQSLTPSRLSTIRYWGKEAAQAHYSWTPKNLRIRPNLRVPGPLHANATPGVRVC